jgi:hypothetical protein
MLYLSSEILRGNQVPILHETSNYLFRFNGPGSFRQTTKNSGRL